MTTTTEPQATSLSTLSEHDWQVLSNHWAMFGIDGTVAKVGRKWEIMGKLGTGFPLFTTKKRAFDVASELVCLEGRHRAWARSN